MSFLRRYLTPRVGRFSEAQLVRLGEVLQPCAFFNVGPFVLLIDLPARWQKHDDPEVIEIRSIADLNALIRSNFPARN